MIDKPSDDENAAALRTAEEFLRTWTTDDQGNRVMRGLTKEETEFFRAYQDEFMQEAYGVEPPWRGIEEDRRRRTQYLELHDKHERARTSAVFAEWEIRAAMEDIKSGKATVH